MRNIEQHIKHKLQFMTIEEVFANLEAQKGIKAKKHPDYDIWTLIYDQIESPKTDPLVIECRGVIVDNNGTIVAKPFDRFFNYGECGATIDWSTANCLQKEDGSLMIMYWYADKWHVGSKGTPNAFGTIGSSEKTLAEAFWQTFRDDAYLGILLSEKMFDTSCTYVWEFCSPENKIVLNYPEPILYLLDIIETGSGKSVREDDLAGYRPQRFQVTSLEESVAFVSSFSGATLEGFVVTDATGRRAKIKNPAYITLHHLKSKLGNTTERFIELIQLGEDEEVLTYFPEYKDTFAVLRAKYLQIIQRYEELYKQYKHIESQKDFALAVKEVKSNNILFAMRKRMSATSYISKLKPELIEALMEAM